MLEYEILTMTQREKIKCVVGRCEDCGRTGANLEAVGIGLHVHRIHRGFNGGVYTLRNIYVRCDECHSDYHHGEGKRG